MEFPNLVSIRGVHNTVLQESFLSKARNACVCCASAASLILSFSLVELVSKTPVGAAAVLKF
jgi:hypothetical protein